MDTQQASAPYTATEPNRNTLELRFGARKRGILCPQTRGIMSFSLSLRRSLPIQEPITPLGSSTASKLQEYDDREEVLMPYALEDLTRLIAKHNFCILATQGLHGPHVAGVGYFANGLDLYIATNANTAKARNVRRDPRVAVHIPIPWPLIPAPPKSIQFRGNARILPIDDANANAALERGSLVMRRVFRRLLKNIDTKTWGESVWIHVHPRRRIETFMIGVPSTTIFRDESKAMLHFDVP